MDIHHEETDSKGRYWTDNGATLTYSRAGRALMIVDHTEVPDALRGTGAGAALVARAVADARADKRTILPLCPFTLSQFKRHPEWRDIWNGAPKT